MPGRIRGATGIGFGMGISIDFLYPTRSKISVSQPKSSIHKVPMEWESPNELSKELRDNNLLFGFSLALGSSVVVVVVVGATASPSGAGTVVPSTPSVGTVLVSATRAASPVGEAVSGVLSDSSPVRSSPSTVMMPSSPSLRSPPVRARELGDDGESTH